MPKYLQRKLSGFALLGVVMLVAVAIGAPTVHSSANVQGDADCSGAVAAADAVGILGQSASVGDAACADLADTDCDSAVDVLDALNILLFLSGGDPLAPDFCGALGDDLLDVVVVVDSSLEPSQGTIEAIGGGQPQPVEVVRDAEGTLVEYVGHELVYKAENPAGLDTFLDKHGGTLVRDGTTGLDASSGFGTGAIDHGYNVVELDPSAAPADQLAKGLIAEGLTGKLAFSSEDGLRLMAMAVADADDTTQLNGMLQPSASLEHQQNAAGIYIDAEATYAHFISAEVTAAWRYLRYQTVPLAEDSLIGEAPSVAIIDSGFALSPSGVPQNSNIDFFPPNLKPAQRDISDDDSFAGGEAEFECGGDPCPWHGTGAFGVCCAMSNNYYGGAGSAGNYVVPVLLKVDNRMSTVADAIRWADMANNDVITMSLVGSCGHFCRWFDGDIGDAVDGAGLDGHLLVAGAGNSLDGAPGDITDESFRPCEFVKVICVGSNYLENNLLNWGSPVDIWAWEGLPSTVTPASEDADENDWGLDEVYRIQGSSSSTPMVAGVLALMKALNPNLTYAQSLQIVQETATPRSDPKITSGEINALRAVLRTRENLAPVIYGVPTPVSKQTYGYANLTFRVVALDPEPGSMLPEFLNSTVATFSVNGQTLCTSDLLIYVNQEPGYQCQISNAPIGTFNVIVTVTDPFGAQKTAQINEVTFVNTPPTVDLIEPLDGETFYTAQTIDFSAYATDPEEPTPFPELQIEWTSSIDGFLGTGSELEATLTQGTHTITVSARDGAGVLATDSITLVIQSGAGLPIVNITAPADGSNPPQPVTLTGNAFDPEDLQLTGMSLAWYSSIDGFLGNGESIVANLSGTAPLCGTATHIITLRATDSDLNQMVDQITVYNACIP